MNELLSEKFRRQCMIWGSPTGLATHVFLDFPLIAYQERGAQGLWNGEFLQLITIQMLLQVFDFEKGKVF